MRPRYRGWSPAPPTTTCPPSLTNIVASVSSAYYPTHIAVIYSVTGQFQFTLSHYNTTYLSTSRLTAATLCSPISSISPTLLTCLQYNGQHNYNHNVFISTEEVFTNVWVDADEVGGQGDDDPEELLAHADDAADPGEEGQGGDVELRPRLLHLTVEVNEQAVPVLTRAAKDPSVFTITEKAPTRSSPDWKSLLTY